LQKEGKQKVQNNYHFNTRQTSNKEIYNFHSRTVQHLEIIKVFFSPTDAQVNCLKNNIKIYIKTSPTCFGSITPSSGSVLFEIAKVTVVKIF
jgi:hypothetical protein